MIPFTKAHACGNDFLIITEENASGLNWAELARRLCARSTSVGADGIEFFAWTGPKSGRVRLHNADGSIAEISGNGTRCVAAWMANALHSLPGEVLEIITDAGPRLCQINALSATAGFTVEVTAGMGIPAFEPHTLTLARGLRVVGIRVSTGNPHFVIVVDNAEFAVAGKSWQTIGAEICMHPDFPRQTNVEFVRVLNPDQIEIRIFERGVGPTTSSGTGTSAAATAAVAFMSCLSPVTVVAPGGVQTVIWEGPGTELRLTGPASLIAHGEAFYA
ncbi:MAG TPA: diaminopimelate epimerase [Terracidiphilus sp.]